MTIGLRELNAPRDIAMSGGASTRGFWTKRKRSATSMVAVLTLLVGVAVAFKMFDQTVPNNVVRDASAFSFAITAADRAAGETAFRAVTGLGDNVIFRRTLATPGCGDAATAENCNVDTYPGDSRLSEVILQNTQMPAKTASFYTYVDPSSIAITKYDKLTNSYLAVATTDPDYNRYLSFWTLKVDKQTYFNGVGEYENDPAASSSYAKACGPAGLKELNSQNPCSLGQIKGKGTMGASLGPNYIARPSDDRQYKFQMVEVDDGTDQSKFQGWRITFSLVFGARMPAQAEPDRTSTLPS